MNVSIQRGTMLHPHVPEGLKHFSKHMFATFLGLVMALGFESCHQRHLQHARAHRAMDAVRAEIKANRKELETSIPSVDATIKNLDKTLQSIQAARHRKGEGCEIAPFQINLVLPDFSSAAWEASVAAQAVHYMEFEQVESLSRAYLAQKFVENQQPSLLEDLQHLGALPLDNGKELKGLQEKQLDEIVKTLLSTQVRLNTLRQGCNQILQKYDAALAKLSQS
jgi:hypothetical protein